MRSLHPPARMNDIPPTRATLILRLKNSADTDAWEEFAEIYQPLIFRLASSRGLQPADAADVVQEVMTRIASAINRFNPNPSAGTFRGWVSRITRNLVIDFLRNRQRISAITDDASMTALYEIAPPPSQEADQFDLEHERQIFLWAAEKVKGSFSETTWQAFWMTAVLSQPASDTATKLGLTKGAVYIARSRVMAKLKNKVESTRFDSGVRPVEDRHE